MDFQEIDSMRRRHVNLNVYVSMSLVEVLDRIADAEGVNTARVIERVLRKGLQVEREERAAKA